MMSMYENIENNIKDFTQMIECKIRRKYTKVTIFYVFREITEY